MRQRLEDWLNRILKMIGWEFLPRASIGKALHLLVPSFMAVGLVMALFFALERDIVGQLSDVINPDSAAEASRLQFFALHHHVTIDWCIKFLIVLAVWCTLLVIVFRINWGLLQRDGIVRRTLFFADASGSREIQNSSSSVAERPNGGVSVAPAPGKSSFRQRVHESSKSLVKRPDGGVSSEPAARKQYFMLVISTWFLCSLPPFITILFHVATTHFRPGRQLDPHGMAMLCALSLLVLLCMTVTLWVLGTYLYVGFWLKALPFLPILVLIVGLFSGSSFTENGKGILNKTSYAAGKRKVTKLAGLTYPAGSDQQPLVIICTSGGGSRAALFTAGILSRLWWQEGDDKSERPSGADPLNHLPQAQRRLLHPDQHYYPGRLILMKTNVLSSVSGGSLASAYFMESLYRTMLKNGRNGASEEPREDALQSFFNPSPTDPQRPPVTLYGTKYDTPQHPPTSLSGQFGLKAKPVETLNGLDSVEPEKNWEQFETNPFINAMRQDHLAATATGFFMPWLGRGPSIERFWEQRFGWYDGSPGGANYTPRRLSMFYDMEADGRLPHLILNSTITRTGTRLAITNLPSTVFEPLKKLGPNVNPADLGEARFAQPLPMTQKEGSAESSAERQQKAPNRAEQRFDPLPGQLTVLSDLDPWWDISLATAVHASANFPYGFPLMKFYRRNTGTAADQNSGVGVGEPLIYNNHDDVIEVSDGGVIDNTGLDSVMALLRAMEKQLQLEKRKVLIFQIDSGELPVNKGADSLGFLLHQKTENENGMWRANQNNQADLQSVYLDELCAIYGENRSNLTADPPIHSREPHPVTAGWHGSHFAFYRVRPGEITDDHVLTSWHLDRAQRHKLYGLVSNDNQGLVIRRAAEWLINNTPSSNG